MRSNYQIPPQPFTMRSQVKWGIALIATGCVLLIPGLPFLLFYAVPLVLIGAALIAFRGREESIEEVHAVNEQ
jgi:hypothetical protein